jgi:hypothetical protein
MVRPKGKPKKKKRQRRAQSGLEDTIIFTASLMAASHLLRRFLPELNKLVTSEVCMCGIPGGCGRKKRHEDHWKVFQPHCPQIAGVPCPKDCKHFGEARFDGCHVCDCLHGGEAR